MKAYRPPLILGWGLFAPDAPAFGGRLHLWFRVGCQVYGPGLSCQCLDARQALRADWEQRTVQVSPEPGDVITPFCFTFHHGPVAYITKIFLSALFRQAKLVLNALPDASNLLLIKTPVYCVSLPHFILLDGVAPPFKKIDVSSGSVMGFSRVTSSRPPLHPPHRHRPHDLHVRSTLSNVIGKRRQMLKSWIAL